MIATVKLPPPPAAAAVGVYRSVHDELRSFESVDLAQVREVLDRYSLLTPSIFTLGPLEKVADTFRR